MWTSHSQSREISPVAQFILAVLDIQNKHFLVSSHRCLIFHWLSRHSVSQGSGAENITWILKIRWHVFPQLHVTWEVCVSVWEEAQFSWEFNNGLLLWRPLALVLILLLRESLMLGTLKVFIKYKGQCITTDVGSLVSAEWSGKTLPSCGAQWEQGRPLSLY